MIVLSCFTVIFWEFSKISEVRHIMEIDLFRYCVSVFDHARSFLCVFGCDCVRNKASQSEPLISNRIYLLIYIVVLLDFHSYLHCIEIRVKFLLFLLNLFYFSIPLSTCTQNKTCVFSNHRKTRK